ncbi:MmcQ/YjbR family DNA-binding protein [Roseibium sp. CAU 1637]|uniref:MmcQ/YjbR family DNA-binding protein n=1 Tax=Roseibium limicola TaxID=2816037 RepID=A0A939JAK4_9HYPH|nr:MmcQ/YjbR family DNA-binding protein [Roseibium limicola]MBO0346523.1 MmcQ/YjbR family DNA-binding protein [Roseibium limicola]
MTRADFDAYCASLKATTHVIQWGNASVWKVGGKIFAICSNWGSTAEAAPEGPYINFKCSDLSYQILTEQDGIVPAPYLARAKWVQVRRGSSLSNDDIKTYIRTAHEIIAGKLTKKLRQELGLQ